MAAAQEVSAVVRVDRPLTGVVRITLSNGAALNTLTFECVAELDAAIEAAREEDARVVIVTGSGKAFCVGAHIKYFTPPDGRLASAHAITDDYVRPILDVFGKLQTLPAVTIAAINATAFGGGLELALNCDFRIAAEDARVALPEVKLGVVPAGGGLQLLAKIVGRAKALEIILLGDAMSGREAAALGVVTKSVPAERLMDETLTFARRFLSSSPRALAAAKRAIFACETADHREADKLTLAELFAATNGPEWIEGMTAFVEKRRPSFDVSKESGT